MKKKSSTASKNAVQNSKKLQDLSVVDFMNTLGDSSSEDEQDMSPSANQANGHVNGHAQDHSEDSEEGEEEELDEEESDVDDETDGEDEEASGEEDVEEEASGEEDVEEDGSDDEDAGSGDEDDLGSDHKEALKKLKELDPEFYKYLEENDKKLLQFDVSDSDDSEKEDENVHRPPAKLETNSDDSDPDDDDDDEDESSAGKGSGIITLKMVEKWRATLQGQKSLQAIGEAIQAFNAAVLRVAPEEERSTCRYQVDGSAVFNAVVQMCVLDLLPALRKYLGLSVNSLAHTNLVKCKRWPKLKTLVRSYVVDLLQLLGGIASINITTILLKHIHQMTAFVVCFPNVTKQFLKKMITLWATGEETVRVVAFMCILRATSLQQKALLDQVLRHMYMAYVQNTKFVSPSTLPSISFMRRSLTELFLLDENVSYHHAFLYIRQLAIHLRNAITLQKKDSYQSVCNWQFISSLSLWVELLGASTKQVLQPLLYPIVQITTGAIKLVPTKQYYPLRFHCVRLLMNLSRNSGAFIPVLPFILEILSSHDFNKKHTKVSMRPLDFSCILRLSRTQLQENGFKDAVIDNVYALALEYLSNESQSIAFPDLALPCVIQIKEFLKKCKIANYSRKLKQISEKVEENSKFIENERKSVLFQLHDTKAVRDWETAVRVKGTPLEKFFKSWQNLHNVKQNRVKKDEIDITENFPKINRSQKKKNKLEGPVELLPSDDSDSDDIGFSEDDEPPKKVPKKRAKKEKRQIKSKKSKVSEDVSDDDNDVGDIVGDVNLEDW